MNSTSINTAELATQIERRVARLTRWLRSEAHTGWSMAALLTLARLDAEGPMRITNLATAEAVTQPTMTGLVSRLEEAGFVRRTPDADDARAVRVAITSAGRKQLDTARSARAAVLRTRLDALDPDALAGLADALRALDHLLDTEINS
jgi:DNA-binding MarR family transcriptional regulator